MVYSSEVATDVSTTDESLRDVIVWADATPIVWKIITGTKSGPFGRNANTYLGYARGASPETALLRAVALKRMLEGGDADFFRWRAEFTLTHYSDKGFRSGFFRQQDTSGYSRGCCELDYTPETREEVIDRFLGWCDECATFETKHVTIDEKIVRVVSADKSGAVEPAVNVTSPGVQLQLRKQQRT